MPGSRLPRASGDRPVWEVDPRIACGAPPRERGSAHIPHGRLGSDGGSPARAGIGPCRRRSRGPRPRLPRARGDWPTSSTQAGLGQAAPPRERGSARHRRHPSTAERGSPRERGLAPDGLHPRAQVRGSPARAGIGPTGPTRGSTSTRLPRASGDRPSPLGFDVWMDTAPPRERGLAQGAAGARGGTGGSPARAGIGPRGPSGGRRRTWLPRASGDRPCWGKPPAVVSRAPPRERGSAAGEAAEGPHRLGSPARAGIGPSRAPQRSPRTRLPRASGDRPTVCLGTSEETEAPPRERGLALGLVLALNRPPGLPRASGDRPCKDCGRCKCNQAPPRERGLAPARARLGRRRAGSPARAGIGPRSCRGRRSTGRLPRASGDWPRRRPTCARRRQAPPRERGLASLGEYVRQTMSGSPARAGIGPTWSRTTRRQRRLPRASGDWPALPLHALDRGMAPPRERGSARIARDDIAQDTGSPARAGIGPGGDVSRRCGGWLPRASGDWPRLGHVTWDAPTAPPRERGSAPVEVAADAPERGSPARAGIGPERR